ncbi:MAG: TonB-dependent receptor plug domain-containing protein, partial [Anaerolineae bacterium]
MSIFFDQAMDRGSVEAAFTIDPPTAGRFVWTADTDVSFLAHEPFANDAVVRATLGTGARDAAGNPILSSPYVWSFRTWKQDPEARFSYGLPAQLVAPATGEGLPGVNVQILGTVMGGSTSLEGTFEIRKVPFGIYTLRVSMIGYAKKNVEDVRVDLDPVVVSVSKWEQDAANTSASVEVLTAKDILQRSPVRIEDALETAAGVQILQENVNIRGSDGWTFGIGGRVLVMMDGVPLMTSDMGSVNWFMVSPADIERAEIVRGAGSAIYGSSAMGGVINFITRSPNPKSRTYIRAMAGIYDEF